eukprot:6214687-Pleurochrysis_carterae.AAC.4
MNCATCRCSHWVLSLAGPSACCYCLQEESSSPDPSTILLFYVRPHTKSRHAMALYTDSCAKQHCFRASVISFCQSSILA